MTRNASDRKPVRRGRGEGLFILFISAFVLLIRVPALVFSEDLQTQITFDPNDVKPVAVFTDVEIDTSNIFPISSAVSWNTDLKVSVPESLKSIAAESLDLSKFNYTFTPATLSLANLNLKPSFYSGIFGSSTISLANLASNYAFSNLNFSKTYSALSAQLTYSFSSPVAQAKITLPQVSTVTVSTGTKSTSGSIAASPLSAPASNPSVTDKAQGAQKATAPSKLAETTASGGAGPRTLNGLKSGQSLPQQVYETNPAVAQGMAQTTVKLENMPEQPAAAAAVAAGAKVDNTGPANEFTFSSANPNKKDASKSTGSGVNPEMLQDIDLNVALQQGMQSQRDNQSEARTSQYSAPMTGLTSDAGLQSPISAALLMFQDNRIQATAALAQPQPQAQEVKADGQADNAAKEQDKSVKTFLPLPQQRIGLVQDETRMMQNVEFETQEAQEAAVALPNVVEEEAEGTAPVPAENDLAYQNNQPQVMLAKALNAFKNDPMDLFGGSITYQEVKKEASNAQDRAKLMDRGVKVETANAPSGPITAISAAFNPMRIAGSDRFFTAFEVPPSRPIKEALNELVATARSFYRQALDYWTQK